MRGKTPWKRLGVGRWVVAVYAQIEEIQAVAAVTNSPIADSAHRVLL